jgi:uncharacterized Ntn-hydrolase superfamily protein
MTFSIVARSEDASLYGIAIASSSPAVAARCVHLRAGVGAVATQSMTDPALGPQLLQRLERGQSARAALDATLAGNAFAAYRQLIVVNRCGSPAVHSGEHTLGLHACDVGECVAAAGNLLADADVPRAMLHRYAMTSGHLGARLLEALRAGLDQGGESGPIHSAGLVVVRDVSWPIVDLRVDWHDSEPLSALTQLWNIYAPQIEDYVARALNPSGAPAFGVPGEAR